MLPLRSYLFIHKSYSKKEYVKQFLCKGCIKNHRKRIYDEFITAEIINFIPDDSVIVPEFPPSLSNGNISAFNIKGIEKEYGKKHETIDRCKVSHDPNRNKMVGFKEYNIEEADKKANKKLTNKEIDDIFNSKPLIEEAEKKMIEDANN